MPLLPVLEPHAPSLSDVYELLQQVQNNNWYTNHGPLEARLREKFADLFARPDPDHLALFSSGTTALTACLQAMIRPAGGACLTPSWTFVGTVCAIAQAGLEPVFVDVDAQTWAPSVEILETAAAKTGARAAVVVAPFGGELDYDGLVAFSERSGVAILIDAAAGLDWMERLAVSGRSLPVPIMVSLHATKLTSACEGGLILWDDKAKVEDLVAWSNFGINGARPISLIGANGKLSEVHAAYGQASLAIWPEVRERMTGLAGRYVALFEERGAPISFAPNIRAGLATSTFNVRTPLPVADLWQTMAETGFETRRWWREGVHRLPAYADTKAAGALDVTERLAASCIGLPLSYDLAPADQEAVVERLCKVLDGAHAPAN